MSSSITPWGESIVGHYPDPTSWPKFDLAWKADVFRFASLWLTEGVPFAFRDRPIIFEYARERLAKRLGGNSKDISLTGSARTGFSLNPSQFGKSYDPNQSDLDLFLISENWFCRLEADFDLFVGRYRSGLAIPRNDFEKRYFDTNADEAPKTLRRGFIDQWRIPNTDTYSNVRAIYLAADSFRRDLNSKLPNERAIKKVSIRIYRDWECAIGQIGGSLIRSLLTVN